MAAGQNRAEYLEKEIQRLHGAIAYLKSAIAHLENQGIEHYNNRTPCVFPETEVTRQRRQHEAHPPEIYEKSGEDFLADFREKLQDRESELAELECELAKLQNES